VCLIDIKSSFILSQDISEELLYYYTLMVLKLTATYSAAKNPYLYYTSFLDIWIMEK